MWVEIKRYIFAFFAGIGSAILGLLLLRHRASGNPGALDSARNSVKDGLESNSAIREQLDDSQVEIDGARDNVGSGLAANQRLQDLFNRGKDPAD